MTILKSGVLNVNNRNRKPYNLLHITSKENAQKILKNGFIPSRHNLSEYKNQWLGDGVCFWNGNDDNIVAFGKKMLKSKYNKNEMVEIYGSLEIEKNNHINLEDISDSNNFCNFIKKINPENDKIIINLISALRGKININSRELSKIGKFLGANINLYLQVMTKNGYNIDMISGYFYHGLNTFKLFGRNEKMKRQFCIKNIELLNTNISNFKIYNID